MVSVFYNSVWIEPRAEVKMSILLAQYNVPLAIADHLSPIIQNIFDGDVAKGLASYPGPSGERRAWYPLFAHTSIMSVMNDIMLRCSITNGSEDTQ